MYTFKKRKAISEQHHATLKHSDKPASILQLLPFYLYIPNTSNTINKQAKYTRQFAEFGKSHNANLIRARFLLVLDLRRDNQFTRCWRTHAAMCAGNAQLS